jgi:hypothetical protein
MRCVLSRLASTTARVCTSHVVAQYDVAETVSCAGARNMISVIKLGRAIGRNRRSLCLLGDRRLRRIAIEGRGRRKDELAHPILDRGFD